MTDVVVDLETSGQPRSPESDRPMPVLARAIAALLIGAVVTAIVFSDGNADDTDGTATADSTLPPRTSTTTESPFETSTTSTPAPISSVEFEQLLDTPVGFTAWVGGDTRLSVLDIDSGAQTDLEARGYPLLATSTSLIFRDLLAENYAVIDRQNPTVPAIVLDAGDFEIDLVAESRVENAVWLADVPETEDAGVEWRLLSLSTGAPLRSSTTVGIETIRMADKVELAYSPVIDEREDEVWRLVGDAHEFWFQGRVIARDLDRVLAERCAPDCALAWLSVATGDVLPDPVPEGLHDDNELIGGGTWLYSRSEDFTASALINAETSKAIDTSIRRTTRPFAVDARGRWAVMTGSQRVWLLDLETGEQTPIPGSRRLVGVSSTVVLVPNS